MLTGDRPAVPRELRRKRRGRRAGAKLRARRRRYRPVLPSITMGNVRSLPNKMDKIAALTRHERQYRESSILVFTETWLTELTPDTNATLDGFHLLRAERTRESAFS
ncbi:Ribonuclease HII [Dissostichus eleginoides]|uniref:Ribonuclease HII n=1 Tax=Dissostichus eleginoides TaxID=100907 RepID=A0AAD9CL60_DISEL|nr:Ribonuclease HII [Dissostichus eleginoides]